MNLDHLKTYIEVVKTGNFSEVAKKLGISQPAVSFQIQKLEQDLGVRLIDRKQKKLTLTEPGKRLLSFAQKTQDEYNSMLKDINQLREDVVGNLLVTASTIPGDFILPLLLSEFKTLHPSVQIQVTVSDSGQVIEDVENGIYDIGFCGILPDNRDMEAVKIAEDEIVLIVAAGHPFAGRKSVSFMEITEEPFIVREESSGTQKMVASLLRNSGYDVSLLKPSLILGTTEAVVSAVEAQSGIAFVSNYAIKKSLSLDMVKSVDVEGLILKRDFYCIYHKERVVSRLLDEFISFIKSVTI
ncbi:MAG: LysR family transcriptional regulator [Dehalococcoidales bacterium]|nr:MAG: LysR family transcriptional regulator [Dehalococcoidales bacterium]